MNFYVKQRVFTWGDKFSIYDENGEERYFVEGEVFTFGKKLRLYHASGKEAAYIEQQLLTFRPRYLVYRDGEEFAEVAREFALFRSEYSVAGPGMRSEWRVYGDFFDHSYEIAEGDVVVASVSKQWFTLGDAYEISIEAGADEAAVLATTLVIDACLERN